MSISILKRGWSSYETIFNKIDILEVVFYFIVALFFIGKAFKPFVVLFDLLFLWKLYKEKGTYVNILLPYKKFIYAAFAFGSYLIIQSLFFVEYRSAALKSSLETIMYIIMLIGSVALFRDAQRVRRLIYVVWLSVGLLLADALLQYFTGKDVFGYPLVPPERLSAWKEGKSLVNSVLGSFSGIVLAAPLLVKKRSERAFGVIFIILFFTVFVLAGNRSPVLALISAFIFLFLLSRYKKVIFGFFVVFSLIGAIFLYFSPKLANQYKVLLHPTSNKATSNRYHIFLTGLEMMKDHPLVGIGSGTYKYNHMTYTKKVDWKKYKKFYVHYYMHHAPSHVHSVGIDMILSYGLMGFILLLILFYYFFKYFVLVSEYSKLAALGFFYSISPLSFSRAFTVDMWQYQTYLSMSFVVAVTLYCAKRKK